MRALVWLQTPDFAADVTSVLTTHLDDGERVGGDDGEDESFVGSARRVGAQILGGFDPRNRLLAAAAQRCALGCASEDENDADAWLTLTIDTVTVIVGSNARQCDAEPTLDALGAAQRPPERSRPSVSSLAANLAQIARAQDAPALEAALTWHLGENANYCAGEYAWVADTDGALVAAAAADRAEPDEEAAPGPRAPPPRGTRPWTPPSRPCSGY